MRDYIGIQDYQVRFAQWADREGLFQLSCAAKTGLTSLPKDRGLLENKLQDALKNHQKSISAPSGEQYLFVMEHHPSKSIVGTANIVSKIGVDRPFYQYRIHEESRVSLTLGKTVHHRYLVLDKSDQKSTEIGGLFLNAANRQKGVGRFLSLSRMLYMAAYPDRFMQHVIAEMRGVGLSESDIPFWTGCARHFFDCEFVQADQLSVYSPSFIEELLPSTPIHIGLLPKRVQNVIGQVHNQTRPALKLLLSEHFVYSNCVDIMDGGPKIECKMTDIRMIQAARRMKVASSQTIDPQKTQLYLILLDQGSALTIVCLPVQIKNTDTVMMAPSHYSKLGSVSNKELWMSPLYPERRAL